LVDHTKAKVGEKEIRTNLDRCEPPGKTNPHNTAPIRRRSSREDAREERRRDEPAEAVGVRSWSEPRRIWGRREGKEDWREMKATVGFFGFSLFLHFSFRN
jgi:hypothetical protein